MTCKKSIENNFSRKLYEIQFYTLSLIIIILSLLLMLHMFLRGECLEVTNANFTNMSSEKAGYRPLGSLSRSTCFPTNVNWIHDDFPDAFDWRSKGVVGPVIDQLNCNACWAISILGLIESMVAINEIARGVFRGVTTLSVQEMIDCSHRKGCLMGDPRSALEYMIERNMSIVTEEEYPLTLRQEACKIPENYWPNGVVVKSFQVHCKVTKEVIMSLVYNHGPVAVTVNSAQWIYYTDGVIERNCSNDTYSNHVAQIVGYDRSGDVPYYIVKNSWGTDFGIDGYLKVGMGGNLCGIEEYVTSLDVRISG